MNEAVLDCPGVVDATIYGVEIPGADGRAGMAAVVVDDGFDLAEFRNRLWRRLPAYAWPVMVRFCTALDTTETFKQKKQQLVREGFDSRLVTDPLFFKDPKSGAYRPIVVDVYARILDGAIQAIGLATGHSWPARRECAEAVIRRSKSWRRSRRPRIRRCAAQR